MRVACLLVPLFPLAARLRAEPSLAGEAVAACAGSGPGSRVLAATRAARRAGIRPGQTLAQARAILPALIARATDPWCEQAAQDALLELAEQFSPRVEDGGPGTVFLDLDGLERLYAAASRTPRRRGDAAGAAAPLGRAAPRPPGPPLDSPRPETKHAPERPPPAATAGSTAGEPAGMRRAPPSSPPSAAGAAAETAATVSPEVSPAELALGRELLAAAARVGLPAGVGIAASKLAAWVAAGLPGSPRIVPAGCEAEFLAPLPIGRLAPEVELAATLSSWGLRSIGDFARLAAADVHSRLGAAGAALHDIARGRDPRPLQPRPGSAALQEGLALEWPLATLEPFLFVAHAALDRLLTRLAGRGCGCQRLELLLRLEPDGSDLRSLTLPAPTREAKTLLTLVRLELEARPPGAPVIGFVFTAHPGAPNAAQLSLFGPAALSPDRLATTLARLFALLGPGRIGSPAPADVHRPEAFQLVPFLPPPPPLTPPAACEGRGLLAVRSLRPALPLEVQVAGETPHERPSHVRPLGGDDTVKRLRLEAPVRVASGPWQLEEGWWSEQPVAREYWDLELASGPLVRVYRERTSGNWFADGIYD
jgi:protein ImuB